MEQADAASAMVEHMEVETGEPEAEATATASRQHVAVLSREVTAGAAVGAGREVKGNGQAEEKAKTLWACRTRHLMFLLS